MSCMNSYTTLIFDFDYTLADSSEAIIECVNYGLIGAGYAEQTEENIKKLIGVNIPETFQILTGDNSEEHYLEFRKYFMIKAEEVGIPKTRIFDFVPEALQRLKNSNYKLAIVSTRFRRRIEPVLKRDNIYDYFDLVVGGEDVPEHKPDPSGLLMALEKLNSSNAEAVYIGDSIIDAQTADSARVDFIGVLSGVTKTDQLQKYKSIAIVDNISGLESILKTE